MTCGLASTSRTTALLSRTRKSTSPSSSATCVDRGRLVSRPFEELESTVVSIAMSMLSMSSWTLRTSSGSVLTFTGSAGLLSWCSVMSYSFGSTVLASTCWLAA